MTQPAYRVDGHSATRDAFYAVACDPRRSVVVEACAGSGKTWMLVSRIVRALLDGAEPSEILAITYTRAAAGEMRSRLAEWLSAWAAPHADADARVAALVARGVDPGDARRLEAPLGRLYEHVLAGGRPVEIRTFHAWFAQLLRSAPLELLESLGLQPELALVEDMAEHLPLVRRAFHAAVLRDEALAADYRALVVSRGRSQLLRWLDVTWQRRSEIELADAAGTLAAGVESAAEVWPELRGLAHPSEQLDQQPWRDRLDRLARALGRADKAAPRAAATAIESTSACADTARRLDLLTGALFTKSGPRRKLDCVEAELLDDAWQGLELMQTQVAQDEAHVEHQRMTRLARVMLAEFAAYKRAHGLADMPDLERFALALLRDSALAGWVQERLDTRVRHLLVDEFQDTSPLQWQTIHAWLASYAGAGGGASGQRPPSIFIVGDPKQSLYRFRGAEPRVFAAASRFVREGLGGSLLACDHTRRNSPAIIDALNGVFAQAAAEGRFDGFRAHTTEIAVAAGDGVLAIERVARGPRSARTARAERRDTLVTPRVEAEDVLREREAARVAAGVAALSGAGTAGPGAVFVLSRKRQSLRFAALALRRAGIAHGAVEEATLMDAAEAQDLVAVLDVLASPRHDLSLARALKSPLFSAGDDDLVALAGASPSPSAWRRVLATLIAPSPALARARDLLEAWSQAALHLPPHDLLERIVHEGDFRARTLAAVPAEQRHAAADAIDAVLAQALLLDGARYATPYGFVRALRRRMLKAAPPVRADAAQLLTIHGAKGLEADTVFVMDADAETPQAGMTTLLVDWPVELAQPRRCAFVYSEARCAPSLRPLLALERRRANVRRSMRSMSP